MIRERLSLRVRLDAGKKACQPSLAGWQFAALGFALVMTAAGCGSDASSSVTLPGDPTVIEEKITGVVSAPNGVLAAAPRWWEKAPALGFASTAEALIGVSPVSAGLAVSLSLLDAADFADGRIDSPLPLVIASLTDSEGRYSIVSPHSEDTNVCRKMLAAGTGAALTRALVFSHSVDINATSEALVRVVLDYVAGSRAQLCDFSTSELTNILPVVSAATYLATGTDAAEINESAYQLARANPSVQEALRAAAPSP